MRAAILSAVLALTSGLNTRPIIGILSMPNHQPYEQNGG